MGDDATACRNINDLPKVTAIVSSESISQTQAFDMMVRFLQRRPDRQNTNDNHHPHHPHHPHRHYWQDLYHVTETLVVDHNRTTTTTTTNQRQRTQQQLETLRTLRLTAATTTPTTPTTLQSQNDTTLPTTHDTAAAHLKEDSTVFEDRRNSMDRQVLVKKEDSFTHDHHDDVDDGTFHRSDNRDQKAKKKKNKKRHWEENVESSSASK